MRQLLAFIFVVQWFNSMDSCLQFLNTLPAEKQKTAQFVAAPSSRNIGGWLGQPYGLVYEQ